jgi:anhydro-N-acetylmuramic acid kinase
MLVLGLMSGTSADAIDVALARISGAPPRLNAKLLNHTSINFPQQIRKEILRVAEQQPIAAGELSQLNFRLGEVFAEAALAACRRFRIAPKGIALIGSHGQTIFHQGQPVLYLGGKTASTLQIGEPAIIAARTGTKNSAAFP